jgi:hypothetical protein
VVVRRRGLHLAICLVPSHLRPSLAHIKTSPSSRPAYTAVPVHAIPTQPTTESRPLPTGFFLPASHSG